MNRRRFIQCVISAIGGALAFGRPVLRGVTKEIPVTLGNPSVAWHNEPTHQWGIEASSVRERIDELGRLCAAQNPELAILPVPQNFDTRRSVERILADNPEMERDQAFFLAVMEIAEDSI